jgi:hypothetical protein
VLFERRDRGVENQGGAVTKIWWVSRLWNAVRNKVDKVLEGTKDNKGKGTGIYLTLRSISSCKLFPKLFLPAQSIMMKQIQ